MEDDKKNAMLKHLVISEEDTIAKFEELGKKSRVLFHLDPKAKRVILAQLPYTNAEKIIVLLVGRYLGAHAGFFESEYLSTREISDDLNIVINTLGKPILELTKGGYIVPKEGKHGVAHYKLEAILDELTLKYESHEKKVTPGLKLGSIGGTTTRSAAPKTTDAPLPEDETEKVAKPKRAPVPKADTTRVVERTVLDGRVSEYASQHNIAEESLRRCIDFQPDGPRLVSFKKEDARSTTQIKALLLLGGILKHIYQQDSFNGAYLLRKSYLPHDRLDLLSPNQSYRQYFSNKPSSSMELNWAGQKHSIKMLDEYVNKGVCNL